MTTVSEESSSSSVTPPAASDVNAPAPALKAEKPNSSSRMPPSLNQLAARMSASGTVTPPASNQPSSRPRLAAQLLRTGSNLSLSSAAASNADSTAVNPPTTRSGSPDSSSTDRASSPPASLRDGSTEGGEPLTTDRVERLNAESEKKSRLPGYKNIPSLEAITARMAMTRSLSIDGTHKPPEPETYEDPATPGIPQKKPEHPLQNSWTMYFDSKAKIPTSAPAAVNPDGTAVHPAIAETGEYEAGLTVIGEFDTVETFCRYFNWLKPPSKLERNSNYHLFKTGIKPMWEDPANADGGKWVLTMRNNPQLTDRCWSWLTMALVGEEIDESDEICGAVVSLKNKIDRIQLWIRSKDDLERVNSIGRKLVKLLDVSEQDGIGLEFQYNSEDRPPPNKFLTIHSSFPQSGFRSTFNNSTSNSFSAASPVAGPGETPVSAGPGGAFSGFGGGSAWRGKRS